MLIVLPDFTVELNKRIEEVIKDVAIKNRIDLRMIEDSLSIENAKENISNSLVNLYWNYKVEERKMLEEFSEDINIEGCGKELCQCPDVLVCGQDTDLFGKTLYCKDCKKILSKEIKIRQMEEQMAQKKSKKVVSKKTAKKSKK